MKIDLSSPIIANAGEDSLRRVLGKGVWTPVEWFNTRGGWWADETGADGRLSPRVADAPLGSVAFPLAGSHNRSNALAALAAARHAGVPPATALAALEGFAGVKRRLEVLGVAGGVTVYDDFAHHPTAIEATIDGLRRRAQGGRILAVVEPRSNTMKLGVMKDKLSGSLRRADAVFCYAGGLGWDARAALAPR